MKLVILIVIFIFLSPLLFSQEIFDIVIANQESNVEAPAEKSIIELIGLVERGMDDEIAITFNSTSRSRISYFVKGDCYSAVEELLGNYIHVKGYLGEQLISEWIKEIVVIEIIRFSSLPFELDCD